MKCCLPTCYARSGQARHLATSASWRRTRGGRSSRFSRSVLSGTTTSRCSWVNSGSRRSAIYGRVGGNPWRRIWTDGKAPTLKPFRRDTTCLNCYTRWTARTRSYSLRLLGRPTSAAKFARRCTTAHPRLLSGLRCLVPPTIAVGPLWAPVHVVFHLAEHGGEPKPVQPRCSIPTLPRNSRVVVAVATATDPFGVALVP